MLIDFAAVLFGFFALSVWIVPKNPSAADWTLRFILPAIIAPWIWLKVRRQRRPPETLRDHLGLVADDYFGRNGLCFAFVPKVVARVCWMHVYFQSRHGHPCVCRIVLQSPRRAFSLNRAWGPNLDVTIRCDGGAFGVCRVEMPIPAEMQGKAYKAEVGAFTRFPNGPGKIVRFREGMSVSPPAGGAGHAASTALLLLAGVTSRAATVILQLPSGVATLPTQSAAPVIQILDRPELPTGGFPVSRGASPPSGSA